MSSTRFTPETVLSSYEAITALNANFSNIASLFDKCVFRDGTDPNSMLASLDMNGFSIENVGAPSGANGLVRQSDIADIIAADGSELALLGGNTGSTYIGFLSAGTNAVARTAQAKLRDLVSTLDFDTHAHADAAGVSLLFVPANITSTIATGASVVTNHWGPGRVTTADGHKHGKYFANVTTAPSSFGNHNFIDGAFDGDLSHSHFQVEHRITGAATLGTPTTGYTYTPEAYPHYTYLYNSSGHNEGTATNVGRTAAVANRTVVYQAGQGDAVAYNFAGYVQSVKAGATSFLASPAVCGFNGDITVGVDGGYANPYESSIDLGGKDAAAVGYVINIKRDVGDTGAGLGAYTSGFRAQSTGSYPLDSVVSGSGPFKNGLDLTPLTMSTKGAVTMKRGDRIFGNASSADGFKATTLGTDWIEDSTSGFWNVVFNNTSCLQISDQKATFLVPFQIPTVHSSNLPLASASNKGVEYFVDDSASNTRGATLVGGAGYYVKVYSNGTNWIIA